MIVIFFLTWSKFWNRIQRFHECEAALDHLEFVCVQREYQMESSLNSQRPSHLTSMYCSEHTLHSTKPAKDVFYTLVRHQHSVLVKIICVYGRYSPHVVLNKILLPQHGSGETSNTGGVFTNDSSQTMDFINMKNIQFRSGSILVTWDIFMRVDFFNHIHSIPCFA